MHARVPRWPRRACAALAVTLALSGCGDTSGPDELPDITPPAPRGKTTSVDPCDLLPLSIASDLVGRDLRVVGLRIEPVRLETLRCDLGERFAEPVVSVELTTDPVAESVFMAAYGEEAGGDPVQVRRLQRPAVLRTEGDEQSIHVYVRGAVVTVRTDLTLRPPVGRAAMVELARLATRRLPGNPVLSRLARLDRCAAVGLPVVEAALMRPVSLAREFDLDGSVACSWGGQPGAVTVSMTSDTTSVQRWLQQVSDTLVYIPVDIGGTDVSAYSSNQTAGDLVVFSGPRLYRIALVPAPGFFGAEIATTDPEQSLATEVVGRLR